MLFCLVLFGSSYCQLPEGVKREKDIKQALCHTWNFDLKGDTSVKLVPPPELFSTIEFMDNNSLIITTTSAKVASWKYDAKSHHLIVDLRGQTISYRILKLTSKELVLQDANNMEKPGRYWRND